METYYIPIAIFASLGLLAAILLMIASKLFAVKTDERIAEIDEILPHANCGACGYSSCREKAIAVFQGKAKKKMCLPYIIEKERYIVQWKDIIIEIDEFHGVNEGLCIAEIELDDINQTLPELPGFIGQEVSHDSRYSNSYLALLPYTMW